ncbi:Flp pilus assembly protein CpaB [Robertmurraya korlensis]|uniref:Flp pilus assembly protein CpaB n=1 Tax=Robertmurraya korlensis TaxID=519977 RepID=UPI000824EFD0|nr:Flp pilus assembly protein CpaB [Robertmurraya korlensis]
MFFKLSWRIILIILSAGAIAFSTYSYLDSLQQTVKVVVAANDIPAHSDITDDMLEEIEVEVNSAEKLLNKPAPDKESIIGGISLKNIPAGQPIEMDPDNIIFPENRKLYLNSSGKVDSTHFIPKDKRLLTVALEPQASVNNLIEQGDWVDVIYTSKASENNQNFANMVLQQVEVFDVEKIELDDNSTSKTGVIQHVTLLVSAQEATILTLAKRQGSIDLVLNPWNGEKEQTLPVTENVLQ